MYKLLNGISKSLVAIQRISDGAFIPIDPANTDYIAYLAWVAEGGQPLPADE